MRYGWRLRDKGHRTGTTAWDARDTRLYRGAAVGGHMRARDGHQLAPGAIHAARVGRGPASLSPILRGAAGIMTNIEALSTWCQAHLHSGIDSVIFEAGFTSRV